MPEAVYRMMTLLCALAAPLPVGTNLGLLHLLWMLVSGQLLSTRGAVIPGLSACDLSPRAVRRAWAALGQGAWSSTGLLARWQAMVVAEGRWQVQTHEGYHPVGVDVTAFWRPRLQECPTTHYSAEAGRALPAIPVGLIGRVGSVGGQRLAVPLALVRAEAADPRTSTHERRLVRAAVQHARDDDALVLDAGFGLALLQEEGAARYVVRCAKNATFRRGTAPVYQGRGRPPTRGALVRPLPRCYRHTVIPATSPDRMQTWVEEGAVLRAEIWTDLRRADAPPESTAPPVTVIAVHDPRYREPLLLATSLTLSPQAVQALYRDRWPVEQLPLAAKQMLGAARQFVSAPETCQRLPALALLAGAILSYAAATAPAIPTGFWDRRPQPTPGRLRRALARCRFPPDFPLPARLHVKNAPTAHLPTGFWGQRGRRVPSEELAA
jgi:DDE family transposase